MWGADRHGERGITVMKAWVVILTLRVKLTYVLRGWSLSPATRRRCLLSVGQMSCKCHEKVGISS